MAWLNGKTPFNLDDGQKIHLAWLNGKTPFNLDDGRKIHSAGHSAWLMGEWPNGLSARQLNNRLDIRLGKDAIQLLIGSRLLAQRCGIVFFFGGTIVYLLQPSTAGCCDCELQRGSDWQDSPDPERRVGLFNFPDDAGDAGTHACIIAHMFLFGEGF